MTLVELMVAQSQSIAALTTLMQQLVEHTSNPQQVSLGMTDVEAQAFSDLKAQVATQTEQISNLSTAIQTVLQAQTANTTGLGTLGTQLEVLTQKVAGLTQRIEDNFAADTALRQGIGDLSQLGGA